MCGERTAKLEKMVKHLQKENSFLREELKKLEKRLAVYENPLASLASLAENPVIKGRRGRCQDRKRPNLSHQINAIVAEEITSMNRSGLKV
jgi:predicted RNase H-like nuclease (RuvC/YqgF family)